MAVLFSPIIHPLNLLRMGVKPFIAGLIAMALLIPQYSLAQETTASSTTPDKPEVIELRSYVEKTNNYPIDLQTVLKFIEDQNLALAQSKVDEKISRTLVRQQQAALLPNVEGSYGQSRFEGGTQVFGGETFNVIRTTVQPQIALSWTLHPGGKQIYDILAAKRREDATKFQVTETYQEQPSNAAQEYYQLLSAHLEREIALQGIMEAEAQVKLNEALLDAGRGLKADLMRTRATLAQQKRTLTEAETAIVKAEQALLNRMNLDTTIHLIPKPEEGRKKPLVADDIPTSTLLKASMQDHPQLSRINEELKALGVDYKSIRSDFIPSVTFRTYANQTGPDWQNLERGTFRGISVSANLLQNLGLQIPLRLQEKKGQIERKVLEQQQAVRNIESEITTSYLSGKNFEAAIEASKEEFTAAEEAYRLALGRYKTGFGKNLDVIDAQTELTRARNSVTQAVLQYNQAQVQLLEAMGKATPETLTNGVTLNVTP